MYVLIKIHGCPRKRDIWRTWPGAAIVGTLPGYNNSQLTLLECVQSQFLTCTPSGRGEDFCVWQGIVTLEFEPLGGGGGVCRLQPGNFRKSCSPQKS